jgi:hypothetical protein
LVWLVVTMAAASAAAAAAAAAASGSLDGGNGGGPEAMEEGERLFKAGSYEEAAAPLWRAVLMHEQTPPGDRYDVQRAFQMFLGCYAARNRVVDGLVFVSEESYRRGQEAMGRKFLDQALAVDPSHPDARRLKETYLAAGTMGGAGEDDGDEEEEDESSPLSSPSSPSPSSSSFDDEMLQKSPEELYQVASEHFSNKQYEVP